MDQSKSKPGFLRLLAVVGWFAVAVQFYLMLQAGTAPVIELALRFLSYFTILTNALVAISCTSLGWFPGSSWGRYFSSAHNQTAIAVYITVVSLVYNTILRFLWEPTGWQRLVDELLHSAIPVLYVLYWWIFVRSRFQWTAFLPWLRYPLVYLGFILVRGHFSGFYPYPFTDVTQLGYPSVLLNCAGMTLLFVAVSVVFIAIGRTAPIRQE
ncbi:Pr6Pr family membrane protein [Flavobacterium sp.]|uniref:Pr6Pr family membrane protein n=1 Tax=Flavobacterium sp. TaxID=239 RepID=UPI0039E42D86